MHRNWMKLVKVNGHLFSDVGQKCVGPKGSGEVVRKHVNITLILWVLDSCSASKLWGSFEVIGSQGPTLQQHQLASAGNPITKMKAEKS